MTAPVKITGTMKGTRWNVSGVVCDYTLDITVTPASEPDEVGGDNEYVLQAVDRVHAGVFLDPELRSPEFRRAMATDFRIIRAALAKRRGG